MFEADSPMSKGESGKPKAARNARELGRAVFSLIHHFEFITHHFHGRLDDRRKKSGFTLIELLVVIAIISLLVSILLPSLKKAKELAQQVTCMSAQRSIGIGIGFYMEEYDAYYPLSNWSGGANPTWDGGYRCFVSQLWPYDIDPSSGIYNCPSADPIRDVTKADIDAAAAAGSGWRTYDYVGKYSMFYNTYLGYWSGTDWLGGAYEIKQADKIKAPICLMHCGDLRVPGGVGPLNSGGLSLYRPGMPSYDKWNQGQFQLPHGDEPNILWHDLSVTGPSENGDYGYYLDNGEKDVIFHDEEGNYH